MHTMLVAVLLSSFVDLAVGHGQHPDATGQVQCPGSPASTHAWFVVEGIASASCSDVRAEMLARVAGQADGTWRDPHDGGGGNQKYTLLEESENSLLFSRLSSNGVYTDKQKITFTQDGEGKCAVAACSESQGSSGGDQSTNYCNLRNLYCGTAEKCCPIHADFSFEETQTTKSSGASKDASVCLGGKGGSGGGFGGQKQSTCLSPFVPATATPAPSVSPTAGPTVLPTNAPSQAPTQVPTLPTASPTKAPTNQGETYAPTYDPTSEPTESPTLPTSQPTTVPTQTPTAAPTQAPPSMALTSVSVVTTSVQPVASGATTIQVADVSGLSAGMSLTISGNGNTETKVITTVTPGRRLSQWRRLAAGSVTVDSAFAYAYPAGATVSVNRSSTDGGEGEGQSGTTVDLAKPDSSGTSITTMSIASACVSMYWLF